MAVLLQLMACCPRTGNVLLGLRPGNEGGVDVRNNSGQERSRDGWEGDGEREMKAGHPLGDTVGLVL